MKKVESTSEESIYLAELVKDKPQADHSVKYYKDLMEVNIEIHTEIQREIASKKVVSFHFVFGFIPVITIKRLSKLDVAMFKKRMVEIEDELFNQKQYYDNWLDRVKEHDEKMEEITNECNQNFDTVLEKAKEIKGNIRLIDTIRNYSNENNNQDIKNGFYMYLKQEINNNKVFKMR